MKSTSNTFTNLMMRLLILFPIVSLFQYVLPDSNKILFAVLICVFIMNLARTSKVSKKMFLLVTVLIINHLFAMFKTEFPLFSFNTVLYFGFWFLYSILIIKDYKKVIRYFKADKKYVINVILIWNLIVGLSAVFPTSYERGYFVSFLKTSFRLDPIALMMMILSYVYFILENRKRYLLFTIIPLYCIFMGESRTYLGVAVMMFLIGFFMMCKNRKVFIISLIPIILILIGLVSFSNIQKKIDSVKYTSESYLDYWGTVTNGRSVFWQIDLKGWSDSDIGCKLLGNGFNFVYDLNYTEYGGKIWAHNDFIQVLLTFGLVGVILYIYSIYNVFKLLIKRKGKHYYELYILAMFVWLINAFFNMMYTYFCTAIALPILVIIIRYWIDNREEEILENNLISLKLI